MTVICPSSSARSDPTCRRTSYLTRLRQGGRLARAPQTCPNDLGTHTIRRRKILPRFHMMNNPRPCDQGRARDHTCKSASWSYCWDRTTTQSWAAISPNHIPYPRLCPPIPQTAPFPQKHLANNTTWHLPERTTGEAKGKQGTTGRPLLHGWMLNTAHGIMPTNLSRFHSASTLGTRDGPQSLVEADASRW